MGGENTCANSRKISRAADWRAHRRESRRARTRALHHDFRRPRAPPLHAGRSPRGLERGKVSGISRRSSVHSRYSRNGISWQALHHAAVFRLRVAGRDQPALQISAGARRQRPFRRIRLAYADGLRLRSPGQRGRSGQVRCGNRFARRHGDPLRRHRSRKNDSVDDHQLARVGAVGNVSSRR